MLSERDVFERIDAEAAELRRLEWAIARLRLLVELGDSGWREAARELHELVERRQVLRARLQALRWVLVLDDESEAPCPHQDHTRAPVWP